MQFRDIVITNAGQAVFARAAAQRGLILWENVVYSSTNLESQTLDALRKLTILSSISATGTVTSSIASDENATCTLHTESTNTTNNGYLRAFGIYARVEGEDTNVLAIVGRTGGATASYLNAASGGLVRLFLDVSIHFSDYAATAVQIDASNYAQADALAATNHAVETLQGNRPHIYPTLLHAAAHAQDGDVFCVRTHAETQVIDAANLLSPYMDAGRIINGKFVCRSTTENTSAYHLCSLAAWLGGNFVADQYIGDNIDGDIANTVRLKNVNGEKELFVVNAFGADLVITRTRDGSSKTTSFGDGTTIEQFATGASSVALLVKKDEGTALFYRIMWFDTVSENLAPQYEEFTAESEMEAHISRTLSNADRIEIHVMAGRCVVYVGSSTLNTGALAFVDEKIMHHADNCYLGDTANIPVAISADGSKIGEVAITNDVASAGRVAKLIPTGTISQTVWGIQATASNCVLSSMTSVTRHGTTMPPGNIILGNMSCGCFAFSLESGTENNGDPFARLRSEPMGLDYTICKCIDGAIVPVIM